MKLLLLMANCGMLLPPFASLPPMDDLPKLSKHDISRIMDSVSRAVKALPKASTKKTHKRVQSQLV